ncbi:hypothetical protein MLD38_030180 [Melastoma candidum]|uniref:Uncharacterized protein n=1 Tax=Melastoma candidum TaxID=119954 RepID=A0ACB9MLH3_9MYRT|nr:hypothetical protein MLD38_030180 [Melastoma candidum]
MVNSKAQSKKQQKKQNRGVDFKKIRRKVGKKLPPPKNATNTEIKSKAIILPEQSVAATKDGLAVNKKGLTLKELLQQTSHHNPKVRRDALHGIRDLFLNHPEELSLHKYAIMEKLRERISDDDTVVREVLYRLFKSVIFPACKEDNQGPLVSLLMAYVFNAMTHLRFDLRLTAFKFFDLIIQFYPATFLLHAEQILQRYEDTLHNKLLITSDWGSVKTVLASLLRCLELLSANDRDGASSDNNADERRLLHSFEPDLPTLSSGHSLVTAKLKGLLPNLICFFKDLFSLVQSAASLDMNSFESMLSILQSIDIAVRFLISGSLSRNQNVQKSSHDVALDGPLKALILRELLSLFPLHSMGTMSGKDEERLCTLNVVIAEIYLNIRECIRPPTSLEEEIFGFVVRVLLEKNLERRGRSFTEAKISLLPFIPRLLSMTSSWRTDLLQAFSDAFNDCKGGNALPIAFLAAVDEMILPGRNHACLDSCDPEVLNHQISWMRELPRLLSLQGEKNPSISEAVLRLLLRLGQCTCSNSSFGLEYDNMQYLLLEFFGSCPDKGSTTYGPFVKLPPVCQELAICCLYYFSHLDLPLLKSLSVCCQWNGLEPTILIRIIDVLDSSYVVGRIRVDHLISFFITLLSCYKVLPVKTSESTKSNHGTFMQLTRAVCSCLSRVGDRQTILQIVQEMTVDILISPSSVVSTTLDNKCALMRVLVTLDSKPTSLSENSLSRLSSFLPHYLVHLFSHIPRDGNEASLVDVNNSVRYYLTPCLFLFERCDRLLNIVLDEMASLISSKNDASDCSNIVRAIISFLSLINEDMKSREMLRQSKSEIKHVLQTIYPLQSSDEELKMTLHTRHELRSSYLQLNKLLTDSPLEVPPK